MAQLQYILTSWITSFPLYSMRVLEKINRSYNPKSSTVGNGTRSNYHSYHRCLARKSSWNTSKYMWSPRYSHLWRENWNTRLGKTIYNSVIPLECAMKYFMIFMHESEDTFLIEIGSQISWACQHLRCCQSFETGHQSLRETTRMIHEWSRRQIFWRNPASLKKNDTTSEINTKYETIHLSIKCIT